MSDAPVSVTALETIEVSAAELLEVLALVVAASVPRQHLRFDLGGRGRGEDNVGRIAEVGGRDGVSTELLGGEARELDAGPDERTVVVGGVGVVDGRHQVGVAPVDSAAVVEQATLDGQSGGMGRVGGERSASVGNGGHRRQSSARGEQLSPGKFPTEVVH